MKKIIIKCLIWGKRNVLKFITIVCFVVLCTLLAKQQVEIRSLNIDISEIPDKINSSEEGIKTWVEEKERIIVKKINIKFDATNSRIDIIDSSIKPEKKRRNLIVTIRTAISNNTTRTMNIRNLNKIADAVIEYSFRYNLTIPQILAQMKVESDFNINARSKANAQGLMQIMPTTLEYIRYKIDLPSLNTWNIYNNIRAGCYYMSEQIEDFGNYESALRAYNWGPRNLRRFNVGEISAMPKETEEYVPKVLKYVEVFETYGL